MAIRVTNYQNYEALCCSLPIIEGEVIGVHDGEITVWNRTSNSEHVVWPVINGHFKVLINLVPEANAIVLSCDMATKELSLIYKPLNFKRFVRLVYIVCQDDCGSFQSPAGENNSVQSAVRRISLAAQMLQVFTFEKIKSHGLRGKTFCLDETAGRPICHVFRSALPVAKARSLSENELWEYFAVELMRSNLRKGDDCKFLAITSFTQYVNSSSEPPKSFSESRSMVKGYAALAAGGLALLGSACLHTWPQTLAEVPWRFGDTRKIDPLYLMDDSCNRGWYWACYATSLGATLHELGHIFDLGHTSTGIMARGFDNIHRFFIIDLFYCSRTYQKKYNPHYQKSHHEREHSIKITKHSKASWSVAQQDAAGELKGQKCVQQVAKNACKNSKTLKISDSSMQKSKPPWRSPHPPEMESFGSINSEAFWARSSALILFYHKWFNDMPEAEKTQGISRDGTKFLSASGIRVVEYRDEEGMAFYHMEFTDRSGLKEVDVRLSGDMGKSIPSNVNSVKVHVQDSLGNILQHVFSRESVIT